MRHLLPASALALLHCTLVVAQSLPNGSFEQVSNGHRIPDGWLTTGHPALADQVVYSCDSSVSSQGRRSAAISIKPTHPDRRISYNVHRTARGCQVGKTYVLTGRARTERLKAPPYIVVQCLNKDETKPLAFATTRGKDGPKGTTDWTTLETKSSVPEGTEVVRVRAGISAPENAGGTVWFDDISIREVE